MRTRRGLLAGIGASTALIAAGTLALLALSAVIAFNGWPTSPLGAHDTPVLVLQPAGAGATAQRAARPIVVAAPAAPHVAKATTGRADAHRATASARDRAAAKRIPGVAAAPVHRPASAQQQVAKVTVPAAGHKTPTAPATVDATVQAPAAPAPAPVTVPAATTPVPPPPTVTTATPSAPPVVQQVTGTVDQTVGGVTNAVGGLLGGR